MRLNKTHRHQRKVPTRVSDFWSLRRRISETELRKDCGGKSCKRYLPSHASKLSGLEGESVFDDASGLEPCFQDINCYSRLVRGGCKKIMLDQPSVGMYFLAVILEISFR